MLRDKTLKVRVACLFVLAGLAPGLSCQAWADKKTSPENLQAVAGLRKKGRFESALQLLKRMASSDRQPRSVADVVPLERAITLHAWAFRSTKQSDRRKRLEDALAAVKAFVARQPKHSRVVEALSLQAKLFMTRADQKIADSQIQADKRSKLVDSARQDMQRARRTYETARKRAEQAWRKFPVSTEDKLVKQRREAAEVSFLLAQLGTAEAVAREAATWKRGSDEHQELFTDARKLFTNIHSRYRSQIGGIYARLWQGRCCAELGEIRKALGIYDEILEHPTQSASLRGLQSQALHFKLEVLNHPSRKDYRLAEVAGQAWLKKNPSHARTQTGLGIRYQVAIAQERIAASPKTGKENRQRLRKNALKHAKIVSQARGRYRETAKAMVKRLEKQLGKKD